MPAKEMGRRQPREQAAEERDHHQQHQQENSRFSVLRCQPWDAWSALRRRSKDHRSSKGRVWPCVQRHATLRRRSVIWFTPESEAVLLHAVRTRGTRLALSLLQRTPRGNIESNNVSENNISQNNTKAQGVLRGGRMCHVIGVMCRLTVLCLRVCVCLHAVHTVLHAYSAAMQMCVCAFHLSVCARACVRGTMWRHLACFCVCRNVRV